MTIQERVDAELQRMYERIPVDAQGRKIYNPHGQFVERVEDLPVVKENTHDDATVRA